MSDDEVHPNSAEALRRESRQFIKELMLKPNFGKRNVEGKFRATGRTTRLLEVAIEEARIGKVMKMGGVGPLRGMISIRPIGRDFSWADLRDRGMVPSTIALVDHYALERRYPAVTQMLYQFMVGRPLIEDGWHRHVWGTRYVTIEGVDCASGMECECGAMITQDEVEAVLNYGTTS